MTVDFNLSFLLLISHTIQNQISNNQTSCQIKTVMGKMVFQRQLLLKTIGPSLFLLDHTRSRDITTSGLMLSGIEDARNCELL